MNKIWVINLENRLWRETFISNRIWKTSIWTIIQAFLLGILGNFRWIVSLVSIWILRFWLVVSLGWTLSRRNLGKEITWWLWREEVLVGIREMGKDLVGCLWIILPCLGRGRKFYEMSLYFILLFSYFFNIYIQILNYFI